MGGNINVTPAFVLAGEAVFTVSNGADGKHYTFKVWSPPENKQYGQQWFISVLVGPNNIEDYEYMGKLVIP